MATSTCSSSATVLTASLGLPVPKALPDPLVKMAPLDRLAMTDCPVPMDAWTRWSPGPAGPTGPAGDNTPDCVFPRNSARMRLPGRYVALIGTRVRVVFAGAIQRPSIRENANGRAFIRVRTAGDPLRNLSARGPQHRWADGSGSADSHRDQDLDAAGVRPDRARGRRRRRLEDRQPVVVSTPDTTS